MDRKLWRLAPQIILIAVTVAVGASIVLKEFGVLQPAKSQAGRGAQSQAQSQSLSRSPGASQGSPGGAPKGASGAGSVRRIAVRQKTIAAGSIVSYTKLHGDVISDNEVKIYPNVGGKLLERKVSVGSVVAKGDAIALVDPSKVGENYMPNPVESTVSGTVLTIPVQVGDTISANTVIATVGDLSSVKVSAAVPERFLGNLRVGTPAEVVFDAIPGATYAARVAEMNPIVDASSRTLAVKLAIAARDSRIKAGMFGTVMLVTDSKKGVVVAPRSAVTIGSDGAYVFVIKGDGTVERRTVTLGLESDEAFEIKSGLARGENVVTDGKSSVSNGDSVRVIDGEEKAEAGAAR